MKMRSIIVFAALSSLVLAGCGMIAYAAEKATKKEPAKAATKDQAKETSKPAAAQDQAKETPKPEEKKSPEGNAAVVNGKPVTNADYQAEMDRMQGQMQMASMGKAPDPAQLAETRKKVLDNLIGRELLRQESERLSLKADDAEVNTQIQSIKSRFPAEADFASALQKMNLTEATLKVKLAQDFTIRKLIDQEVASKITVAPEEAKKFYDSNPDVFKSPEMVRASHILVQVDKAASAEDKAKAKEKIAAARKKVVDGADFATVAKEVSDCPSKEQGGDLDFFQRGQMTGPFEQAAFSLPPNQLSDIVETEFGYHIIKVTDHKDAGTASFDEMKERIETHLKQQKVNEAITQYVDGLKSKAKIEVLVQ